MWAVFVFFEVAIAVGNFGVMGSFGTHFSATNFRVFGGLALFYPFALIALSYRFSRSKTLSLREAEIAVASVLLFLLLLILQFVFFSKGVIGEAIVTKLRPYLGIFGISILSLLGSFVCLLAIKNEDVVDWFRGLDFSKTKQKARNSIILLSQTLLYKILSPLAQMLKNRYQKLIAPKPKISTPPIDLEIVQPVLPTPTPTLPNPQQQEIVMDDLKDLPIYKEKKDDAMFDDDIEIQEYVVTQTRENKVSGIKVLDGAPPPSPKPNPFSYEELIRHRSSNISSSVEIKEKIRGKIAQKQDLPPVEIKKEKPSLATKITPTPLQNNPLASLAKTQTPKIVPEEIKEQLSWESEVEDEPLLPQDIEESKSDVENLMEEIEVKEELQEIHEEIQIEEEITEATEIAEVLRAPKEYASAFEITPPRPRTIHSKVSSLAENEALLQSIDKGKLETPKDYKLPPISLLSPAPKQEHQEIDEGEIDEKIESLLEKLSVFKIEGDVERTYSGPIITTLEFRPAPNVKVSRIQSLENDIAMALEAKSIRIQAPIPGKSVVGIEIPNNTVETIYLREIFESDIFKNSASPLTLALGKDVVGNPFVTDLKKLPHLLIAGTTGSGKSVGVNAMILSLLYRNSPDDLKLMMVDPKMVEFMPYTDLPHLITPIITDPKKAVIGLANAVREMERRYTLMSQSRTKEIVSYNQKAEELGLEKFPYFVIIIDELADLMMTAGKEVEYSMARIAQMGRASGMHLIVATQSPRAEVLTGLIKTNLPAHLSYKVGTKIDAGIIGCPGAETLLGRGDLLFTPPGASGLVRLHAPWSSEDEVNEIVSYIKDQREVMYDPLFAPEERESLGAMDAGELSGEDAELVARAREVIMQDGKTSISYIQRRLGIGYNKAANIVERLEQMGFLSAPNSKGVREIVG